MAPSVYLAAGALLSLSTLLYILKRLRRPRARAATVAFCYSAAAVLTPHRTTNLEFFAPSPPGGHFDNKPTILREFVEQETSPMVPRRQAKPVIAPSSRTTHNVLVISKCLPDGLEWQPAPLLPEAAPSGSRQPAPLLPEVTHSGSTSTSTSAESEDSLVERRLDTPPSAPRQASREASLVIGLSRIVVIRAPCEGEYAPDGIQTAYFQTEGPTSIDHPPAFTSADKLELGDVFHHRNTLDWKRSQLWLWEDDDDGLPHWKPIKVGCRRQDGRRLILTKKRHNPSWVAKTQYSRQTVNMSVRDFTAALPRASPRTLA
ncbi:hypothetical protein BD414DRAFT_541103 [Trametes punicea]|nr:hypothetical protein BD414DRAFT_541103 [Trametes punicea]